MANATKISVKERLEVKAKKRKQKETMPCAWNVKAGENVGRR